MYHSINFTRKDADGITRTMNSWEDWHLVCEERPSFQPPAKRTNFLTVPGANGSLDLSEALTGYPTYERRTGSIEFTVTNDIAYTATKVDFDSWTAVYDSMCNFLHNQEIKAVLEDEPAYYYIGRFYVNKWKSDKYWSKVTVDYELQPFKKDLYDVSEDWLWDPFSFENGIILTDAFNKIRVTSTERPTYLTIIEYDAATQRHHERIDLNIADIGLEPICPTFRAKPNGRPFPYYIAGHYSAPELGITDYVFRIPFNQDGSLKESQIPEVILYGNGCRMWFYGNGEVTVSFHKGRL